MNELISQLLALIERVDANSPVVKLIKDIIASVVDPNASTILQDLEDVLKLLEALQSKLNSVHPSIKELVKKAI